MTDKELLYAFTLFTKDCKEVGLLLFNSKTLVSSNDITPTLALYNRIRQLYGLDTIKMENILITTVALYLPAYVKLK